MIEDLLNCKDLYDPIKEDNAKSSNMSDDNWMKLKKKRMGAICQWVNISLYNHVAKETNPHTLWKNLKSMCDAPIPEGPLTTRQPAEYSWISGNLTPLH